jgi:8-oxo-dGTP diphosphatase
VIVAAAIILAGRVLACERSAPPEVAGRWEFPGGKVEPGETDAEALARECVEELGVRVEVGARVGPDVPLAHGRAVLRVYAVTLLDGDQPRALEHTAMRWLGADELHSVPWLPADRPIVAQLPALLG